MIKASHSKWAQLIFDVYLRVLFKRYFHRLNVTLNTVSPKEHSSMLLLANHFSWWDGFFWYYLNKVVWKKKFHIMMLEEQLKRYWFFRFLGAFSIRKNSRSVMESFAYASKLLADPNNLVLIFPQGEIQPLSIEKIKFERGIELLKLNAESKMQLVFGYAHTEYESNPKPTVRFFLQTGEGKDVWEMQQAFNKFRSECTVQTD